MCECKPLRLWLEVRLITACSRKCCARDINTSFMRTEELSGGGMRHVIWNANTKSAKLTIWPGSWVAGTPSYNSDTSSLQSAESSIHPLPRIRPTKSSITIHISHNLYFIHSHKSNSLPQIIAVNTESIYNHTFSQSSTLYNFQRATNEYRIPNTRNEYRILSTILSTEACNATCSNLHLMRRTPPCASSPKKTTSNNKWPGGHPMGRHCGNSPSHATLNMRSSPRSCASPGTRRWHPF